MAKPRPTRDTRCGTTRARKRRTPELVESATIDTPQGAITFELRLIDCGRCAKWHGPYWYGARHFGGRTRWVYIGRELDVAKAIERMDRKVRTGSAAG